MLENQPQNQQKLAVSGDRDTLNALAPAELRTSLLLRLLSSNTDTISDCEFLELMLGTSAPLSDKHGLAIRLLERFGSLGRVMHAEPALLREVEGIDETVIGTLAVFGQATQRIAKSQICEKPLIHSWSSLMSYLRVAAGYGGVEQFRVLFLNHRHMVIYKRNLEHYLGVATRENRKLLLEQIEAVKDIMGHIQVPNDIVQPDSEEARLQAHYRNHSLSNVGLNHATWVDRANAVVSGGIKTTRS